MLPSIVLPEPNRLPSTMVWSLWATSWIAHTRACLDAGGDRPRKTPWCLPIP